MLVDAKVMAFVATMDAGRSRAFYETRLGLRCVEDGPYALVFDLNGIMLRVQKVEAFEPQPFTALGWQVDDIAATARELTAKGIEFLRFGMPQDDLGIWDSGAGRIAWFKDSDGNTLSLTQFH
jgi:predicted enzyme related to lactoylglutathione lyase